MVWAQTTKTCTLLLGMCTFPAPGGRLRCSCRPRGVRARRGAQTRSASERRHRHERQPQRTHTSPPFITHRVHVRHVNDGCPSADDDEVLPAEEGVGDLHSPGRRPSSECSHCNCKPAASPACPPAQKCRPGARRTREAREVRQARLPRRGACSLRGRSGSPPAQISSIPSTLAPV